MSQDRFADPAEIARQKRELFELLLREEVGIETARPGRITPRQTRDDPPLSFAQQRLWFLDQWEPGSPAYNIPAAVRLRGRVDRSALQRSLDEIVRRHESLRTTFATIDGRAVQIIAPEGRADLHVLDLRPLPQAQRTAELETLASAEARRPFSLEKGPLMRVCLVQLSEVEHALLFNVHHIVSDGWSMGVLVRELATLYSAETSSGRAPMAELPIQYADFAVWQREWLKGERLEESLRYWKDKLSGATPFLRLPSDRPRPAVLSTRGSYVSEVFPGSLSTALATLSRKEGATPFMTALAALKTLLYRYTGQTDISVGSPIANRARPETEGLIGFFANTLVLRTDLSGAPTFRELLRRVRDTTLEAYAHQDLPFEKLVEEMAPVRDAGRQPFFQVALAYQNAPMPDLEMAGLSVDELAMDSGTSKFDLTLTMDERADGLGVAIEYATDLFDRSTIVRTMGHLRTLLSGIVADPDVGIADLPILPERERRLLLGSRTATPSDDAEAHAEAAIQAEPRSSRDATALRLGPETEDRRPAPPDLGAPVRQERSRRAGRCLHGLFEEQAASRPDAVALVHGPHRLTYGELDARASSLAKVLQRHDVGPESLVGLCLDRSIELVVGILGILKAGGAYVPLDLSYPEERQALILHDSRTQVIVTQPHLSSRFTPRARVISLGPEGGMVGEAAPARRRSRSPVRSAPAPSPDNTAYVIYTSGSTGRPKGVPISHANVARLFDATRDEFGFHERDVWTLFHSCAFDFSVWELWGALLHGGRLVIVPWDVTRSPSAFHELLAREGVTVLNQTPSFFRQLVRADEAAPEERELSLRLVIFGGEALELGSLRPWFDRHGDESPRLVNMYGITETTIHVTSRALSRADLDGAGGSVVGPPVNDLYVRLLDERRHLVPIGVPGEIWVGGSGVARGYLNRPDLTAERFAPDPFAEHPGARLYRSGDLARRLANGDLEYLGRIDDQVKVRGYRIEPGEIEAALGAHPAVHECVVAARSEPRSDNGGPEGTRLVAWVVPKPPAPSVDDLRDHLRRHLPAYMVPSTWVFLDALPVTAHGKVDRSALPEPSGARPELRTGYAPPRDPVERILASVWCQVLGLERVGIHDNFFALGGDSILSIQLRARARECGLDFSIPLLFTHQTIAEMSRHVVVAEGVGGGRRGPFELLSEEDRALVPSGVEDAYPLSQLQAGFVFHSEYSPDYIIYITSFTLRAPFDAEVLRSSVRQLVRRHPMLRTSFDMTGFSEPLQLVHETVEFPIEVEDLRGSTAAEQRTRLESWRRTELTRRFDWAHAPLLRIHLHRLSDDTFCFALSEPFLDGWSVASLLTELFGSYFARLEGRPLPDEAPLASTYRDFVALERETMASPESRSYWDRALGDVTVSRFPRWPAPAEAGDLAVARIDVSLPLEVSEGLQRLARELALPLKSVLLAAHLKAVSLLNGLSDVLTGLIANGRPEEVDGERVAGVFLNTLPLRTRLPQGSWSSLVTRAFEAELETMPHRRFPMAELQRRHGGAPLFDTAFNYTNFHVYRSLSGVEGLEVLDADGSEQTYFALTAQFNLDPDASRISAALDYRTAEVSHEQAQSIASLYARVLAAMAAQPFAPHAETGALTPAESRRILSEWNDTAKTYPPSPSIHALIEAQAAKSPEAVAVDLDGERLTYRELNARANQLAHHLRELGVGVEGLVGICLHRSFDIVVGVLGVLKAGGAYVPADPSYPPERIAFMMEDAKVPVVLTQRRLLGTVPSGGAKVICLDADWERIALQPVTNPDSDVTGDCVAYVLYTSGSTGRPKGAAVTHRATVNLLNWARELVPAEDLRGVLASTSICFDPSVFELFVPLSWGGKVILAENVLHLPALPAEREVTLLSTVPSAIAELSKIGGIPESVRTVTLAGEPLKNSLVARVREQTGVRRVFNLYGLTEDAVYSTAAEVTGRGGEFASIGRPIPNTQIYILDDLLQPVSAGVSGQIHVAGAGLPRGYFNRPGMTAEKFVPDPFAEEAGARMHRTGDLARWLPDGSIEFLGRIDHQVKVRGFRIELGEVESVLAQYPPVRDALVVAREDVPGDRTLVAYLVPSGDGTLSLRDLRGFLKERLPDFMLPAAFVILPALPLTPNGKLNRSALPAPDAAKLQVEEEFLAPRSPVEEVLAAIWTRVLRVERAGVHDNFFEMGGHSLLATQVVSRARQSFRVDLPLRWLFESPTIAGLASRIEEAMRRGGEAPAPEIRRRPTGASAPLSFAQQRLWFLDQLDPGNPFYNVAAAVRLAGPLNAPALGAAFGEIIRRHDILRTTFDAPDGRPVQRIARPISWSLPLTDLSSLPEGWPREEQSQRLATEDARLPFDLTRGPLMRARLLKLADEEHVLLLTMHHIVSDGWSIGVLIVELTALYRAFCEGKPSPLPELPIQYADFAAWQADRLQGKNLELQLEYWTRHLAGAPPTLDLPTDRPRPAAQSWRGARMPIEIEASLASALRELSRREEATLFMTLLGAFAILLSRWSGQEDIVLGTPIANRNHTEIEPLIGFFVNTLAVRTDLSGDPTFRELLRRVRESALGGFAHQDLPFERLVEALRPVRDLSRTPLFQVMLDLHNMPARSLEMAGLTLETLDIDPGIAKFDLTLTLVEEEPGLSGTLEYNTDLFDAPTIARMSGQLQVLLRSIVAHPGASLSKLEILPEEERQRLLGAPGSLAETGAANSPTTPDLCIHEPIEEQARRRPEAIAVRCGASSASYGELDARAEGVARTLRSLGLGPETCVGLCAERSIEMVVGILGILKAGAVYVPLDPGYPAERIRLMLEDARPALVLVSSDLSDRLSGGGIPVLSLDDASQNGRTEAAVRDRMEGDLRTTERRVVPGNAAYVIFTSGSTGTPRGVVVTHRSLVQSTRARRLVYQHLVERFLLLSSFAFDSSVAGIFWTLCDGGTLCLLPEGAQGDPGEISATVAAHKITHMLGLPSLYGQILDRAEEGQLDSLRAVILAGERCPVDLVRRHRERTRDASLFNEYGPTEATVWASVYDGSVHTGSGPVPIGRPIPGARIYLLDARQRPVPMGAVGEVCISGETLSRGYLGRPEDTAGRFLPDPFGARPGARLYRTGDLAKWRPSGDLEFLGRYDHQVKVRGWRIEPEEIESALLRGGGVREAVVLARPEAEASGGERLVAYVVLETRAGEAGRPSMSELRARVARRLPSSMVPSAFVIIDALPRTATGKVDRGALPDPDRSRPELEHAYTAPRSALEQVLVGIWSDLLRVEPVGVHDNFFDLGGHSLIATQVVSRVRERFQAGVPLRSLFETPTVAGFAQAVGRAAGDDRRLETTARVLLDVARLSDDEVETLLGE